MKNKRKHTWRAGVAGATAIFSLGSTYSAAAETQDEAAARLEALRQQISEQSRRMDELKRAIAEQETVLEGMKRSLGSEALARQRGTGTAAAADAPAVQLAQTQPPQLSQPQPVGQAPVQDNRPPAVAPIFQQPGVLTPRGKFALDPSLQYSYSSSNRVALVGYTVIPAILIGLIDIREVKRNTFSGALTTRYGVTNRLEVEARVPYVYRSDTGVGREFLQGAAVNSTVFDSTGKGIGDVEVTARYQLNDGGADRPYFIGSLRLKSRTGKDPFEVGTSKTVVGFRDDGVQTTLPTGSGFYGIQPALTMLYPSDPAVFFGGVNYLKSIKRKNVVLRIDTGDQDIGTIQPGAITGFNFGMGLALNERSSFSIGYDFASVGKTKQNGQVAADSVRVQLGTLLLGYSFRLSDKRTVNLSLGAGLTRDTPDMTLTLRMPISF